MVYKQQKSISCNSVGLEVAPADLMSGEAPIPCSYVAFSLSLCGHQGKGALFCKGANPIGEDSTHDLIAPQRPCLQIPSHWVLRFSMWILRGRRHSLYSSGFAYSEHFIEMGSCTLWPRKRLASLTKHKVSGCIHAVASVMYQCCFFMAG